MSENTTNENVTDLDPSFFQAYATKVAEDSKRKTNQGNFTPRDFEDIAYAGLETGVNKIFRFVGIPPGAETMGVQRKNFDPKQIMMCEVKDDEGKKFTIRLPLREDIPAHNHILHRLWDKVAETTWINKKKININETKFPELWLLLTKGGYKHEDGQQFSYAAGYKTSTFTIQNVIDRSDSWCKDNKHTKILCREVNVSTNAKGETTVWPKPGVKSFGYIKRVADLVGKYGDLQNYDVAIKRTGDKEIPFEIKNASVYKEKDLLTELKNADGTIPDENIIIVGKMTADEKNFTKYDLDKLYQPTSFTKLLKRVPSLFKLTDAYLGTKFYEELEQLSVKEKEEWARLYGDENAKQEENQTNAENTAINAAVQSEAPSKRRTGVGSPQAISNDKIALLKGWSKLTDAQRLLIKDVKVDGDTVKEIIWVDGDETANLLACDCDIASPESFEHCVVCGLSFIDE